MLRPLEKTVLEKNPFQDPFPHDLFFIIGQFLDVISLCCLLKSCKATAEVFNYQAIWTNKLNAHFPKLVKNAGLRPRELFENAYKESYGTLSKEDKKILALIYVHDLHQLQQKKLKISERLLTHKINEPPVWKHIRRHSHSALKHYIFEQLRQSNMSFSDITEWAIRFDQRDYFMSFRQNMGRLQTCQIKNSTILYCCAVQNFLIAAQQLLALGINPDHTIPGDSPPLYVAAQENRLKMVELLLDYGANLETQFREGFTPIYVASQRGNLAMVQLLIKRGANVNAQCINGSTPLYIAMQEGQVLVVDWLLKNGADKTIRFRRGFLPLYVGARNNHIEAVQMLLSHCTQSEIKLMINSPDDDGSTPLYVAAQNGHAQMCKLLLANGATIDAHFLEGYTPLYVASQNGHSEVVDVLSAHTLEPNYNHLAPNGSPALYIAAQNNCPLVVERLCQKGADPNLNHNGTEYTTLQIAANKNHVEVVGILLKYGAKINYQSDKNPTALAMACSQGHIATVKLLLDKGADFTLCLENKKTPLHIACELGYLDIIYCLISHGASLLAEDIDGKTPIEYVKYVQYGADFASRKKICHLEKFNKIERAFLQFTTITLDELFDYSTTLSQIKQGFHFVTSNTWSIDFFNTHYNAHALLQQKLVEQAPNYFGPLCFCLIVLSDSTTPLALKKQIVLSLNETTSLSAKNKIHSILLAYLGGDSNLFFYLQKEVISPILEGLENANLSVSEYYEDAFLFLSFFERQVMRRDQDFECIEVGEAKLISAGIAEMIPV